ncbi:hypothetical protein ACIP88_05240 [Streptomyces uncialis]
MSSEFRDTQIRNHGVERNEWSAHNLREAQAQLDAIRNSKAGAEAA